MEKLEKSIENLKKELDKTSEVINIKRLNKELKNREDLLIKIKKYQETGDLKLREEICNDSFFKEYKEKETDLNILILKINSKLKTINNRKECLHESN